MKKKLLMGATFLSMILSTFSCKKGDRLPTLPEESAYLLDFSYFQDLDERKVLQDPLKKNWKLAHQNLGIWKVIKNVNLLIPLTALQQAHSTVPEQNENNEWVWKNDFNVHGMLFNSKLMASTRNGTTNWRLYITNEDSFDEFLWLTGTTSNSNKKGYWKFKLTPSNPKPYLVIEWKKQNNLFELQYKNILSGSAEKNSYISYKDSKNSDFQFNYEIFDQSKNNSVDIRWNTTSKEGQIKDPHRFSDNFYHCWDEVRNDFNCDFDQNLSINNNHPHRKNM